jgi:hypothetical protein
VVSSIVIPSGVLKKREKFIRYWNSWWGTDFARSRAWCSLLPLAHDMFSLSASLYNVVRCPLCQFSRVAVFVLLCTVMSLNVARLIRVPRNVILLHHKRMLKHGQSGGNYAFYFSYCGHVKRHKLNSVAAYQFVGDYVELFLNLSVRDSDLSVCLSLSLYSSLC